MPESQIPPDSGQDMEMLLLHWLELLVVMTSI
jgi:hypothetical protein